MRYGALLAAFLGAVAAAPTATAHANFLESQPPPGSRLDVPIDRVVVVLTERVDPTGSGIEVLDASGARVDARDVQLENGPQARFTASLPKDLPEGAYTIRWWALSSVDQHTTRGSVGFAVGGFAPPPTTQSSRDEQRPVAATARFVQFAGYALAFGGAAFAWFVDRPPGGPGRQRHYRRAVRLGALLALAGVAALTWDTLRASALPAHTFFGADVGGWFLGRLAVLGVAAAVALASPARAPAWAAGLVALAAMGTSRFGHASQYGWAALALDYVHLLAVTTWVGLLGLFLFLLARRPDGLAAADLRCVGLRFSRLAAASVGAMAATGVALSAYVLGMQVVADPSRVMGSAYGRVLYAKVALAVGMVAVAAVNRYVFLDRPGPSRAGLARELGRIAGAVLHWVGRPGARLDRGFPWFLATEAIMGVSILALAGVLTSLGAPTGAAARGDPLRLTAQGSDFLVTLYVDPAPRAGDFSDVRFRLVDATEQTPVVGNTCGRQSCVRLTLASPANGSATDEEARTALPQGDGWWKAERAFLFVRPGTYTITVEVQTAEVYHDSMTLHAQVP